jgi:cobalt-zinc-cadmium efflux system outer membrane protein
LTLIAGCQVCSVSQSEAPETASSTVRCALGLAPSLVSTPEPEIFGPVDLAALWAIALANHPALQEAAAEIDAARGRFIQAGKYPNPRFMYRQSVLGTTQDPVGDLSLEATQEIVTAGKRRLDIALARQSTDLAGTVYLGRQFEVLTGVRRAYYEYAGWGHTLRVHGQTVAALEEGLKTIRKQVEDAKIRPRTDLVRFGAVLEEAKLTQSRARINLKRAWRQLAADVGIPDLPLPQIPNSWEGPIPQWDADTVLRRVLAGHSELRRAALEVERARLDVERARAEVIPNITVGGGYSANYPEHQHGGTVAVETPLPLWDRKQGRIREAQAHLAQAQAAEQSVAIRLTRETSDAYGRFEAGRQRVERFTHDILPPLVESLDLIQRGYQTGAAGMSFADVLLTEQTLGETRLKLAEAWRDLGRAIADLEGLMQLDISEEIGAAEALLQPTPSSE